jgi:membrane fusion protein (multidrug efflux system)
MKIKKIILWAVVILCVAGGVVAIVLWQRHPKKYPDSSSDEDNGPPPLVTVQVGQLKQTTLHHYVTGYGTVDPAPATGNEPAAAVRLSAMTAGIVEKVNVVEGEAAKKGDVILELSSAGTTLKYAEEEVTRQKKLYAEQNTSLRNLQNAEAQLTPLRVIAPLSGTVVRVNVTPGAAVDLTTVVAEIVDLNRLTIRAEIPAADAVELKSDEAALTLTTPPVTANLSFVSPLENTTNGTILIRADLPPNSRLHPGQYVELRVTTGTHTNCLAAPAESVVTDIAGNSVIALVKGDEAAQTPVKTGFSENGWVEVSGTNLKAGDAVVTVGAYGLPDKTKIQVAKPSAGSADNTAQPAK